MIKIALGSTFSPFSHKESFQFAKQAGFDGVDYLASYKDIFFTPHTILRYSQKYNIDVTGIHQPLQLVPNIPTILLKNLIDISKIFKQADTYVIHLSSLINIFNQTPYKITLLNNIAKKYGLTLCFESNPVLPIISWYPKVTYDPDTYATFCVQNNLQMTFDLSHIASAKYDVVLFYKKYHTNISIIHMSDFKNGKQHLPLGQGALPLEKLLREIKINPQHKKIIFEISSFPNGKTKEAKLRQITKSLEMTRNFLK